jgi:hypothetical protein
MTTTQKVWTGIGIVAGIAIVIGLMPNGWLRNLWNKFSNGNPLKQKRCCDSADYAGYDDCQKNKGKDCNKEWLGNCSGSGVGGCKGRQSTREVPFVYTQPVVNVVPTGMVGVDTGGHPAGGRPRG